MLSFIIAMSHYYIDEKWDMKALVLTTENIEKHTAIEIKD